MNNLKSEYLFGSKTFVWAFSDSFAGDAQTAYQVRVRVGDSGGTIIYDSGKVTSALNSVTTTIPVGNKNMVLYWEVKVWDTDDAASVFSAGSSYFELVDPATAAITSPTAAQVLTGGTPTLTAVVSATGVRVVKSYVFRIFKAGSVVWTSPVVYGIFGNAAVLSSIVPSGVLVNASAYSVSVMVTDDVGITTTSPSVAFTTVWSAPLSVATPTVSVANYNTLGYVLLSWVDSNREAGFLAWNIYRRDDLIDPYTGTVQVTGTYKLIAQQYGAQTGVTYNYSDYLAPGNNYQVTYLVKQLCERTGFQVESENTNGVTVTPLTDAYWLIDLAAVPSTAYKISISEDSFTDEQEESEYVVIGRGRHVDKGEYLGPKGTLTAKLRSSGGATARQKRLALLSYQQRNVPIYLRNPFGDIFTVNLGSMEVGRISGVGMHEFCDVTLPYAKVA